MTTKQRNIGNVSRTAYWAKLLWKQECIPVGCVLSAALAIQGGLHQATPGTPDNGGPEPLLAATHQTVTPPKQRPPDQAPPWDQAPPPEQTTPGEYNPHDETPPQTHMSSCPVGK